MAASTRSRERSWTTSSTPAWRRWPTKIDPMAPSPICATFMKPAPSSKSQASKGWAAYLPKLDWKQHRDDTPACRGLEVSALSERSQTLYVVATLDRYLCGLSLNAGRALIERT